MTINRKTTVTKNEDQFLASELGDELVMMNLENGDFIGLNSVGGDIVNKIQESTTVGEIIDQLLGEYDVTPEECEADVFEYVELLVNKGILIAS